MLTSLRVENLKGLSDVKVPLRNPTVFTGEFEGKTSLLQALMLWHAALRKRMSSSVRRGNRGAVINPRDVTAVPHHNPKAMWPGGKSKDSIRVTVEGRGTLPPDAGPHALGLWDPTKPDETSDVRWTCGFEFRYLNEASLSARPVNVDGGGIESADAMLPRKFTMAGPVTGLALYESRFDPGAVNVHLGEGRTCDVLRNLCLMVSQGNDGEASWAAICEYIERWHRVRLEQPEYIPGTAAIEVNFRDEAGLKHELIAASRSLQQTLCLLCLAQLALGGVLLLDTPDAGLPSGTIQQHIGLLREAIASNRTQVITVAHSEPMALWASSDGVLVAHRESDLPRELRDEGRGEVARYISG